MKCHGKYQSISYSSLSEDFMGEGVILGKDDDTQQGYLIA